MLSMPNLSILLLFLAALTISSPVVMVVEAGGDEQFTWLPIKPHCQGSVADCMTDDEFGVDSEINRRVLATTNHISYGALQRNTVPCSQRGASYYNCHQGAEANPYNRGCSAITQCRS